MVAPLLVGVGLTALLIAAGSARRKRMSAADTEALGRLLASESSSGSAELWAMIAQTAVNVARRRGVSLTALLQTGVRKSDKKTLHGLGWGPQYDPNTGITRWASTRREATARTADFARRWSEGRLTQEERAAAAKVAGATSFLEVSQMTRPVSEVEREWGNPTKLATLAGWNFYGRG